MWFQHGWSHLNSNQILSVCQHHLASLAQRVLFKICLRCRWLEEEEVQDLPKWSCNYTRIFDRLCPKTFPCPHWCQSMYMFDKFHLTFSFKTKMSCVAFHLKGEKICQLTSTYSSKMSPHCHMPSRTCHIYNMSIDVWFFSSIVALHVIFITCQLVCFWFVQVFACQISKTCKNLSKNTHWC